MNLKNKVPIFIVFNIILIHFYVTLACFGKLEPCVMSLCVSHLPGIPCPGAIPWPSRRGWVYGEDVPLRVLCVPWPVCEPVWAGDVFGREGVPGLPQVHGESPGETAWTQGLLQLLHRLRWWVSVCHGRCGWVVKATAYLWSKTSHLKFVGLSLLWCTSYRKNCSDQTRFWI